MSVLQECYLKRTLSLDHPRNPGTNMLRKHYSGWTTSSRELTWLLKRLLELQWLLPFWRQEKGCCRYSDLEPLPFAKPTRSGFLIKRKSRDGFHHITFCSSPASQRKLPVPTVRRRRSSGA